MDLNEVITLTSSLDEKFAGLKFTRKELKISKMITASMEGTYAMGIERDLFETHVRFLCE